jgi:hypothetical protein
MEMFSVVPRVTDAQPTHGSATAAAKSSLIIECSPKPEWNFTQPLHESKGPLATGLPFHGRAEAGEFRCRLSQGMRPAVTFEPIRGIVRETDSLRPAAGNT